MGNHHIVITEFKNDVLHGSLDRGASQDRFFLCSSRYEMQMKTGTAIIVIEDIFRTALYLYSVLSYLISLKITVYPSI